MKGCRVIPDANAGSPLPGLRPGDYVRWAGEWFGKTPNGLLCGLARHAVAEHADGTITVSPSIAVSNGEGGLAWHGFLENGVWREC